MRRFARKVNVREGCLTGLEPVTSGSTVLGYPVRHGSQLFAIGLFPSFSCRVERRRAPAAFSGCRQGCRHSRFFLRSLAVCRPFSDVL